MTQGYQPIFMLSFLKRSKNQPSDATDAVSNNDSFESERLESQTEKTSKTTRPGWFTKLKGSLTKTRSGLTDGLSRLILGRKEIDDDLLEELEMLLLSADIGIDATDKIIQRLTEQVSRKVLKHPDALMSALKEQLNQLLIPVSVPLEIPSQSKPYVILMVGVNGVGKTTTIGKLAKQLQTQGKSVMLAAGDTSERRLSSNCKPGANAIISQ